MLPLFRSATCRAFQSVDLSAHSKLRLHDLAGEHVQLPVFLSAHLSDFKRARLITTHDRALGRRRKAGWKLDDYASRRPTQVQHGISKPRARPQDGSVTIREIYYKLSLQINPLASGAAIGNVAQITWGDKPSKRHAARRKSLPGSAASSGS